MTASQSSQSHRLLQFGILLFLLGLVTGLAVSQTANPRMALASHIEAVMNGTFLIALGLLWPKLILSARQLAIAFWLVIYGTFANWVATLLAAVWAAGDEMMPQAAQGRTGTQMQELVINILLVTLALAMIGACVLVLAGLRQRKAQN
jgi:(hydroxyamino)benzene mutase